MQVGLTGTGIQIEHFLYISWPEVVSGCASQVQVKNGSKPKLQSWSFRGNIIQIHRIQISGSVLVTMIRAPLSHLFAGVFMSPGYWIHISIFPAINWLSSYRIINVTCMNGYLFTVWITSWNTPEIQKGTEFIPLVAICLLNKLLLSQKVILTLVFSLSGWRINHMCTSMHGPNFYWRQQKLSIGHGEKMLIQYSIKINTNKLAQGASHSSLYTLTTSSLF